MRPLSPSAVVAAVVLMGSRALAAPVVNPLTDTSIYPIAVWAMPASTAPAFAALGVNLFVAGERDAKGWCDTLAASGCVGFVQWSSDRSEAQRQAILASPGFLGWMHGDEPDNPDVVDDVFLTYHVSPQRLLTDYEEMKGSSTPTPMYLNLGQGLANGMAQSTPDSVYPAFCAAADLVCYDVYPTSTQEGGAERLHLVARGVERLRRFAGPDKPLWIWLECTRLEGSRSEVGNRCPLAHELRAEVWMSILYGADGIGYFPHQFNPYRGGPTAIPAEIQDEMRLTNGLLHRFAPILRTGRRDPLPAEATAGQVSAGLWRLGERTLLVAVNMRPEPGRALVRLPADLPGLKPLAGAGQAQPAEGVLTLALRPYEVALFGAEIDAGPAEYQYPKPAALAAPAKPPVVGPIAALPKQPAARRVVTWARSHNTRLALQTLKTAPRLDGVLDEPVWAEAARLEGWTNTAGTEIPSQATLGLIGQVDGNLYLAFRAEENRLDSLVTRYAAAWRNDCIEVWVDPDNRRTSFAHLVATSDGRVELSRTVQDEWGEGRRDEAWTPAVTCRTGREPRAWTVELAVPLADLGCRAERPVIGFDAARERQPGGGENSVWTTGGFNKARDFGELDLSPAAVTLANGRLVNRGTAPVNARVEVLISAPRDSGWAATWEDRWLDLGRDTLAVVVPAAAGGNPGQVSLLTPDLASRVPPGGRVRLILIGPEPQQQEELTAMPGEETE